MIEKHYGPLARCRRVHATLGCEPAQLCVVDDRLECLKILHAAGASMEDAFARGVTHVCWWVVRVRDARAIPDRVSSAEYDDPATDAGETDHLRQGSVTLKTIAEDLLAVVDDPRVNDGARVLVGALVKNIGLEASDDERRLSRAIPVDEIEQMYCTTTSNNSDASFYSTST